MYFVVPDFESDIRASLITIGRIGRVNHSGGCLTKPLACVLALVQWTIETEKVDICRTFKHLAKRSKYCNQTFNPLDKLIQTFILFGGLVQGLNISQMYPSCVEKIGAGLCCQIYQSHQGGGWKKILLCHRLVQTCEYPGIGSKERESTSIYGRLVWELPRVAHRPTEGRRLNSQPASFWAVLILR